MTREGSVQTLLGYLSDWWRARNELGSVDPRELARIAEDLGMTADDLTTLVARGPDAANLLYERLRTLGLTRTDVERRARGLMRELERTCACCNDKEVCEKDLAHAPDDPVWKRYCPNAASLQLLLRLGRGPEA